MRVEPGKVKQTFLGIFLNFCGSLFGLVGLTEAVNGSRGCGGTLDTTYLAKGGRTELGDGLERGIFSCLLVLLSATSSMALGGSMPLGRNCRYDSSGGDGGEDDGLSELHD